MKIIAQGAEATIYKTKLFNKDVIIKERVSKKYRDQKLDTKIIKQRNINYYCQIKTISQL